MRKYLYLSQQAAIVTDFIKSVLDDGGFVVARGHIRKVLNRLRDADLVCPMAAGDENKLYYRLKDIYAPVDGNEFTWQGFTYKVIVKDYNGTKLAWLDRNLGATQVATSSTDADAYGDLYQWGRLTDGHEKRDSGTTTTLSSTDEPDNGGLYIISPDSPQDWRDPQNDDLWQQPAPNSNNPAPPGWRIPTGAEWELERGSWSSNDAAGAFASELKLPMAGRRDRLNGDFVNVGANARYWARDTDGTNSVRLDFDPNNAVIEPTIRAQGFSVRCVREVTS